MIKYALTGAALVFISGCQTASAPAEQSDSFSFIVMGDTPYDEVDEALLAKAIPKIKAADFPFIIHVGDYRAGSPYCTAEDDAAHKNRINSLAPTPVFYTPGDNEWTDCDRSTPREDPATMSELGRLDLVRKMFFGDNAETAHGAERQLGMPENARWSYEGVQFATIHVVSTGNGRSEVRYPADLDIAGDAADLRDTSNVAWIDETFAAATAAKSRAVVLATQADMTDFRDKDLINVHCDGASASYLKCDPFIDIRAAIREGALGFSGPVILIHGDSSPFTLNQKFLSDEAPNLWRLNAAGDAGSKGINKWGTRDVTLVTLSPEQEVPLSAIGYMTGKLPSSK